MAVPQSSLVSRVLSHQELLQVLVIFVAALAVMAVLTIVFGVNHAGPAYDLINDPAAAMPF